ncbi:hypothetical protein ACJX0J_021471, partial [Zea mays]
RTCGSQSPKLSIQHLFFDCHYAKNDIVLFRGIYCLYVFALPTALGFYYSIIRARPMRFRQKVTRFEYHLLPSPSVNKCATLDFYGLFETDIILFLVCAYDANLKQVSFIVADNLILLLLIVADNLLIVADNLLIIWLNILYNLKTVLVGSKNMKTEIYTIPIYMCSGKDLFLQVCSGKQVCIWQRSVPTEALVEILRRYQRYQNL